MRGAPVEAAAAATAAGAGLPLEAVLAEARAARCPRCPGRASSSRWTRACQAPPQAPPRMELRRVSSCSTWSNATGLHARPAARFVATVARFDAQVSVTNLTTGAGPVRGDSFSAIGTLGRTVDRVEVSASGVDADRVFAALGARRRRLDGPGGGAREPYADRPGAVPDQCGGRLTGIAVGAGNARLPRLRPVDAERPSTPEDERSRLAEALAVASRQRRTPPGHGQRAE